VDSDLVIEVCGGLQEGLSDEELSERASLLEEKVVLLMHLKAD
jgi:hypothetical protein